MIITKTENVLTEVFEKAICDRCKKDISDDMQIQEMYQITFTGGYASVFGDMAQVTCDLCQQCLKDLIGDFCIIS